MIKDITIGQFFPGKSFIHRLDPRVKLVLVFGLIILIFLSKNFISLSLMLASILLMTAVSGVPFKVILKSLKPIIVVVIFTAALNIVYTKGGTPILDYKFLHITDKGIYTAIFTTIRIISLIICSSLLTYTTSPTMLTEGIEQLFSPLKFMKNQIHTVAMMMTIALRFIPTLIEEIDRIMSAQKARGANLDSGGLVERAKALVPVLVPLFVYSYRRAGELALAMESRCYRGAQGRTRMKQLKLETRDFIAMVFVAVILAGVIGTNLLAPAII